MEDTNALTQEVAAIIRGEIARGGIYKQKDLAEIIGVSQAQFSKMLRGLKPIDLSVLDHLCFALGLKIHEVIHEASMSVADSTYDMYCKMAVEGKQTIYTREGFLYTRGIYIPDILDIDEEDYEDESMMES